MGKIRHVLQMKGAEMATEYTFNEEISEILEEIVSVMEISVHDEVDKLPLELDGKIAAINYVFKRLNEDVKSANEKMGVI